MPQASPKWVFSMEKPFRLFNDSVPRKFEIQNIIQPGATYAFEMAKTGKRLIRVVMNPTGFGFQSPDEHGVLETFDWDEIDVRSLTYLRKPKAPRRHKAPHERYWVMTGHSQQPAWEDRK